MRICLVIINGAFNDRLSHKNRLYPMPFSQTAHVDDRIQDCCLGKHYLNSVLASA